MQVFAPIVGLAVLGGMIELSKSWRIRSWINRILWLAILVAAAGLCVTLFLD